jgi:hypothetical protein
VKVASFTTHGTAAQSARWKIAAEAEGYPSVGAWLAFAADSYLRARVRAGLPVPLAWHLGTFTVQLDGETREVRGQISPPFAALRGDGEGRFLHLFRLVDLRTGAVLATLHRFRDCKALASELARRWLREEEPLPPVLP